MHTHRNQMNLGVTNPYMAAAAQKIAASERAAKVRKKLLKSAAPAGGFALPDSDLLIGRWMDQRNGSGNNADGCYRTKSDSEPDSF